MCVCLRETLHLCLLRVPPRLENLQIQDETGQKFPSPGKALVAFIPLRHQRAHPGEDASDGDSGVPGQAGIARGEVFIMSFSHVPSPVSTKGQMPAAAPAQFVWKPISREARIHWKPGFVTSSAHRTTWFLRA